jgi:hypothetical protein
VKDSPFQALADSEVAVKAQRDRVLEAATNIFGPMAEWPAKVAFAMGALCAEPDPRTIECARHLITAAFDQGVKYADAARSGPR